MSRVQGAGSDPRTFVSPFSTESDAAVLPAHTPAPAPRAAAPASVDRVRLASAPVNPYAGFADKATTVNVDRWRKGPNDSIEHILRNQGYSLNEIYRKDGRGRTLIERVAQANGLKDPNLLAPVGRKLVVPVKGEGAPASRPAAEEQAPARRREQPAPAQRREQPAPAQRREQPVTPAPQQQQPVPATPPQEAPVTPAPQPTAQPQPTPAQPQPTPPQPQPTPPQPQATPAQPRPPAQSPAEAPAQPPAAQTPAANGNATATPNQNQNTATEVNAEISMLIQGVQDGKFTRPEFQALNSAANQYTELRARYTKEGITPEQMRTLGQVQQQYGQMYARFLADDRAKITFRGAESYSPEARFRANQNDEAARLYDEFTGSRIDQQTLADRLLSQRESAAQQGAR